MVGCSQQSPDLWRKIWRSCKPVSLPLGAADGNSMQDSGQILECLTFPEQQLAPSCTRYQRCQSWQSRAHPDRQWNQLKTREVPYKNHRSICTCFKRTSLFRALVQAADEHKCHHCTIHSLDKDATRKLLHRNWTHCWRPSASSSSSSSITRHLGIHKFVVHGVFALPA